ncbi:NUDIX domain-containing protein [Streptomyces ipomoeae]|jgi:ADP-ribose pyrophosphatase YjhB (NUDIX family)|uniref:Hydrolase, NUDIX family n=2 Tax=Streptomyces ipomoeae TaxID=103232 RepID=L1KJP3_9ACTN|nr:NUDIX hydrolase [Streptomyces ipomoeae]EKX60787.1 hydrolase, NUDIX family [Streptomyces ipomoeae 91-03]MDX2696969.1 NUDIX hydrolase [Streptomyces ipomoeae]MDX2825861.1 NUDIX hydrolase [Streptomyces ipomoeae]MDX2843295.1 NUDIX hydrolase [Streptomyces ipomoeae]MDX2876781.1 NUDIX hydrolase [Streptomyces ipomoeae]
MREELRVAAYAVCVRDGQMLLARWVSREGYKRWTLPGGGMDHGEDPYDTVVREAAEETGYEVEPTTLLGIDSMNRDYSRRLGTRADFHALRIIYEAHITGGTLRHETNGSTDMAKWHPLSDVPTLDRVGLVDVGLTLWRTRPPNGHLTTQVSH